MPQAKVVIADDHVSVLNRLISLLKDRFEIVGAVTDGNLLIDAANSSRPDVVITDLSMPGLNGMEALRQLKTTHPEIKLIVSTLHADAELAAEVIRSGASGFVLKVLAPVELVPAINHVLKGGIYVTPGLSKEVLAVLSHDP